MKDRTRVLLVEDNEWNSDMLTRRLRRRGWEVHLAVDGPAALERAAGLSPDVVLLDMSLPGMDGWEVARRLKAGTGTRRIPLDALLRKMTALAPAPAGGIHE